MMSPTEFPADRRITDRPSRSRPASGGFARYLLAICIGVVATLVWQSYAEAIKQIIATRAPEFSWSPETKQMIASAMQQLGWTKLPASPENRPAGAETPQAASVAQTTPETVAAKAPADQTVNLEQVQQLARNLSALRQTVEQLAAGQDQMAREIEKLQAADLELLERIPTPPRQAPAVPARKPMPVPSPSSRAPIPSH
jgi:hypothetical protein